MSSFETLKNHEQFKYVYDNGKSKANKYLVMYVMENQLDINRIGFTVTKKVGNSVVRHHIKRLLRESYRLNKDMFSSGLDIVFVARVSAKDVFYEQINDSVIYLSKLHNIYK